MEQKIRELIEDLRKKGKNEYALSGKLDNPEAKINVWYVVARLEEALLEKEK